MQGKIQLTVRNNEGTNRKDGLDGVVDTEFDYGLGLMWTANIKSQSKRWVNRKTSLEHREFAVGQWRNLVVKQ